MPTGARPRLAPLNGLDNNLRLRQALANRTPIAVWRDGVTGAHGPALDMTLLL